MTRARMLFTPMAVLLASARRNVPVIFQISQILKIGKQPISVQIGGKYYADSPRYGPNWGARFNFILLFPTGRHPEPVERTGSAK